MRKKEKRVYGSCASARSVESHVVCLILHVRSLVLNYGKYMQTHRPPNGPSVALAWVGLRIRQSWGRGG